MVAPVNVQDTLVTPQLSFATASIPPTIAVHSPGPKIVVTLPGQVNVGNSLSVTVTVNVHAAAELPLPSFTSYCTVVTTYIKGLSTYIS